MATTNNAKHSFWEFKKYEEHEWFKFLIKLLIGTVVLYLASHLLVRHVFDSKAGYEYQTLAKEQLQHINRIYFGEVSRDTTNGRATEDSAQAAESVDAPEEVPSDSAMRYRNSRAIEYVSNQYNNKVDSEQLGYIRHYLEPARALEAISFWNTVRIKVRSYFWLVGPEVYFEIIFWTLLGVIASLLYSIGVVSRNRTTDPTNWANTTFDSSEIPYQFAKLWYAPIATLVIVLGYNFFEGENIADISSSKGVIVFAFIGGFYSARLIAFLDRLKEVLLPNANTTEMQVQKPEPADLANTTISLQLEDESIPAELANDIAETGFGTASVEMENDETGKIVKAEKSGEDQAVTFTVASLPPGKYTARATWSHEVNDQPVNLAGEEKVELKNPDTQITVHLKKAEGEG